MPIIFCKRHCYQHSKASMLKGKLQHSDTCHGVTQPWSQAHIIYVFEMFEVIWQFTITLNKTANNHRNNHSDGQFAEEIKEHYLINSKMRPNYYSSCYWQNYSIVIHIKTDHSHYTDSHRKQHLFIWLIIVCLWKCSLKYRVEWMQMGGRPYQTTFVACSCSGAEFLKEGKAGKKCLI